MPAKKPGLLSILAVMILLLSCNLPHAGAPAAANPNQAQAGKSASQPGQPAQAAPGSPSAFKGGITARAGYDLALPKAQAWSPSAILWMVESTSVNLEGKSQAWTYYFADDTLTSPADRSLGFYAIVTEKGVTEAKPGNINVGAHYLQASTSDWKIEGEQALAACDQAGGSRLRAANPAVSMTATLRTYDQQAVNGMPQPSSKNVIWELGYQVPGKGSSLWCQVDASSGKLYYLGSRYDDPSAQPITARAGFNTALARAREWNPGATLLSARVEFPSGDKTWPVGGVARFWHYQFIVLPEPNGKDYQPAFDVVAGSSGLASFRAGETYTYAAVGNQADWSIDSDEAYRISEENGGKAFRDQHGSLVYGMMLNLGFNQAEPLNTSKNVRWSASYSMESDPYTKLDLQIDAASGKTVSKQ